MILLSGLISFYIIVVFLLQIFFSGEKFFKISRFVFPLAIVLVLILSSYTTYVQYSIWRSYDITKILLPPFRNWNFFIYYSFFNFFAAYVVSFFIALTLFFSSKFSNKKMGGKFLYPEEPALFATGIFLSGHPGWLIYMLLILLIGVCYSFLRFFKNDNYKISFRFLWLPTAVLVIIISKWLINFLWFKSLLI